VKSEGLVKIIVGVKIGTVSNPRDSYKPTCLAMCLVLKAKPPNTNATGDFSGRLFAATGVLSEDSVENKRDETRKRVVNSESPPFGPLKVETM